MRQKIPGELGYYRKVLPQQKSWRQVAARGAGTTGPRPTVAGPVICNQGHMSRLEAIFLDLNDTIPGTRRYGDRKANRS